MKNHDFQKSALCIAVGWFLILTSSSASAAYSVDWWTTDSGGAMGSTGGTYKLSGTIGQADSSGPMLGGNFELVGGFWGGATDQPPCYGDLNGDHLINLDDLAQLLGHYGTPSGALYEEGDLDGDGDIDLSDLAEMLSVYGHPCP